MHIEFEKVAETLRAMHAKKVMMQIPDGLKPQVFDLFNSLSGEFRIVISSDPFFGACDVGESSLYQDVDCIVQFGHTEIPNVKYPKPVLFIEHKEERIPEFGADKFSSLKDADIRKVGLLFSIQYSPTAMKVKELIESLGIEVLIGDQDQRLKYPGQVLGCNYSSGHSVSGKVDCFVLVSTGNFHAIGAQLSLDKDVYLFDLNDLSFRNLREENDRVVRKRFASIARMRTARKICVVVDTKVGQKREKLALRILDQARSLDLEPVLVYSNNASPLDYENMRCETVVFTGCPRVPVDDQERYSMPIVTPLEFQIAFGLKNVKRYVMDEIVAVDNA